MIPYGAQVECRTNAVGVGGNFTDAVAFADIGGLVPELMNNSNHRRFIYATTRRRIAGNASITLDARANHRLTSSPGNDNHWFNLTTVDTFAGVPAFGERGFTASALAIIFPFNSENA
jgi:hypothetical protein